MKCSKWGTGRKRSISKNNPVKIGYVESNGGYYGAGKIRSRRI